MSDSVEAVVAKGGENQIQVSIGRSTDGLMLKVWAQAHVEDFIRSLGSGEHIDIQTLGRHWVPPGKDKDKKMYVYALEQDLGPLNYNGQFAFRLDKPGGPLTEDVYNSDSDSPFDDPPRRQPLFKSAKVNALECLNLSFLRLVGISDVSGVSFCVRGVYQREGINKLAERIERASNRFYREFLKPYRVIVTVSTMPIPEGYPDPFQVGLG